ncbi:MAG: zinc ribbon domain-containing protein [Methanosphaera sp.]|nr:zinc ribbon domain-containing protein [Methanosphaera sp.]
MFCQRCGSLNSDANQYCNKCGSPLNPNLSNAPPQATNSSSNNTIIILCATILIIALIIAGTFLFLSNNNGNNPLVNNTPAGSQNSLSDEKPTQDVSQKTSSDSTTQTTPLKIISGSFYTGSSLSDKTKCNVFVGREHSGQNVKISVLYSRNGKNLNQGKVVPVTVDSSGYVTVSSADAFRYYPDNGYITLYDSSGVIQDTRNVYMDAKSGTQTF